MCQALGELKCLSHLEVVQYIPLHILTQSQRYIVLHDTIQMSTIHLESPIAELPPSHQLLAIFKS